MKDFLVWLSLVCLCWIWSPFAGAEEDVSSEENGVALWDQSYHVRAYRPLDPDKVTVRVSLRNQAVYVREGERVLLAAVCTVGTHETPTPTGQFTIFRKEKKKRRQADPGLGYPMGYWCEFKEGYAIHAGWVHRRPRTNGTIRLHHNAAPKFFELVQIGTPLMIADELPEDETIGRNLAWPDDSHYPELPPDILGSDRVFDLYQGPIWESEDPALDDSYRRDPALDNADEADNASGAPEEDLAEAPFGISVPGKANIILSPYAKDQGYIDIEGLTSGTKIFCPWTNKVIRVP